MEWKKPLKSEYFWKQNNKPTIIAGAFVVILENFCLPGRFCTPESFQLLYSWSNHFLFFSVAIWILPLALESITTLFLWVIFIWYLQNVVAVLLLFPDREYFCWFFGRIAIFFLIFSWTEVAIITLIFRRLNWNVCVVLLWNLIETPWFSLPFKADWE